MSDADPAEVKPRVQSAARAVEVLLAIANSADGLKAREVEEATRLPRQVTYHLLHTLSATGIVRRNAAGGYVLGLAAASIADGFRRHLSPAELLAPRVRALAAASGETAYASGWLDGEIVVIAAARGTMPIQAAEVPPGYSSDAHARATGKLLLALSDGGTCASYLARHPLTARTPNTITEASAFAAELGRIRDQGFAVEQEEFAEGLCCVAVPLDQAAGRTVLGLSLPRARFDLHLHRLLTCLRKAAQP